MKRQKSGSKPTRKTEMHTIKEGDQAPMKKIISGKVYDTSTAKRVGYDGGGDGFTWWHEDLYQKRTGEFFIYGEGGPMTKYAVPVDQNNWSGGSRIAPLDINAAKQWAETHLDADAYESIFGVPDEDDTERTAISALLPSGLLKRVRQKAVDDKVTLTAVLEAALTQYLE